MTVYAGPMIFVLPACLCGDHSVMSARNPPVGCLSFRSASDTSHLSLIYVRAHDEIIALSVMRRLTLKNFGVLGQQDPVAPSWGIKSRPTRGILGKRRKNKWAEAVNTIYRKAKGRSCACALPGNWPGKCPGDWPAVVSSKRRYLLYYSNNMNMV